MRHFILFAYALAAGTAVAATASAQGGTDEDRAQAHFVSGRAYYEQARYEDAAREFLESYRLSARPELLENASRAYERALLFDQAIATLEQMLERHPDPASDASIRERIANLERLRDRVRSGAAEPAETSEGPSGRSTVTGAAPASSGGGISIPGIALLAGGGGLGIVAIITGAVSHASFEALTAECGPERICPPERQGDIDAGNALAITSTVLTFASIALIGVGVVLLVVDTGGGGETARLEVTPNGVALRGTF